MTLHTDKLSTLEQLRAFADGTQARSFQASSRQEAYDCIAVSNGMDAPTYRSDVS